ncbi:MAG: N-acetylmuramoyl-L-alanine amidase [Ignavibacteria bacterium]|jgi:N-acetylmuramoyl-L-alanine amidase|nr:N-acetylmuramoyl-L-alanine amidase [Ignavibacteria bacterium]MDH7528531.1 N-acetylmuramoyl-L-alanine amidase [Ignavibacteria bacterium]
MKKVVIIAFLILAFWNKLFAQLYSFSVNLNGKPSQLMIRAYQSNATFIAIEDLLSVLEIPLNFDSEVLRGQISLNEGNLFITAYNPFLFFVQNDGKKFAIQLQQNVDYRYGKLFVPAKGISNFLNKYTSIQVEINEKVFLINIKYNKSERKLASSKPVENIPQQMVTSSKADVNLPQSSQITYETSPPKTNFDLYDFTIEEKANGYIFRIKSRKQIKSVSKNLSGNFLYLRIPNSTIDTDRFNTELNSGIISAVNSIQNGKDADLKITLREKIQSQEIVSKKKTNDVLLLLHVSSDIIKKLKEESKKILEAKNKNSKFDVIVIDAGHGGRDPGAIGYRGTKEKDVNLGIALKLGKLLEDKLKDVKVIYTRKDDQFVELYRRGQIANENNGKLFISIHCNSTDDKPGLNKGSEVYILRPGRTEDAIRIAEKENSVIKLEEGYQERYKYLSDENFILTAMASTANVRHSEKFAEILSEKFHKSLPLKHNGVKQAGFFVLVGASMPSVLIETGYINHPEDELYLRSEKGQQEIAEAIFKAVVDYKNYYEKLATK